MVVEGKRLTRDSREGEPWGEAEEGWRVVSG